MSPVRLSLGKWAAAMLVAAAATACGGGGGASPGFLPVAPAPAASGAPTQGSGAAARSDGDAAAAVPIVLKPGGGECAKDSADAKPSALLNSQLDCAP